MIGFGATLVLLALWGDPPAPDFAAPVDYVAWLNEEFGAGAPPTAAKLYRDAARLVVDDERLRAIETVAFSRWNRKQTPLISAWVEQNDAALTAFRAAAAHERCHFELRSEDESVLGVTRTTPNELGLLARLTAYRAWIFMSSGNVEEALRDVETLFRAANHLAAQPLLADYLVGLTIENCAQGVLLEVPRAPPMGLDFAWLQERIRVGMAPLAPPTRQILTERVGALDALQRFSRDSDGDGRLDHIALPNTPAGFALGRPQTADACRAEIDAVFDRITAFAQTEPRRAAELEVALQAELRSRPVSLLRILAPSVGRTVEQYHRAVATRRATETILGAYLFRADQGRWPDSLGEVIGRPVSSTRPAASSGPISTTQPGDSASDPFSGADLVYRRTRESFQLYSVGADGCDDGGKRGKQRWTKDEACDAIFWPPP